MESAAVRETSPLPHTAVAQPPNCGQAHPTSQNRIQGAGIDTHLASFAPDATRGIIRARTFHRFGPATDRHIGHPTSSTARANPALPTHAGHARFMHQVSVDIRQKRIYGIRVIAIRA